MRSCKCLQCWHNLLCVHYQLFIDKKKWLWTELQAVKQWLLSIQATFLDKEEQSGGNVDSHLWYVCLHWLNRNGYLWILQTQEKSRSTKYVKTKVNLDTGIELLMVLCISSNWHQISFWSCMFHSIKPVFNSGQTGFELVWLVTL